MLILSKEIQKNVNYTYTNIKTIKGNNLLILGEQHTFSKSELDILKKEFTKLDFIKYNELDPDIVIQKINTYTKEETKSLIVLNTKASVPNELLNYLTKLKQKKTNYISIQNFMEKYLQKCYIPNKSSNITFLEEVKPFNKIELLLKFFIDYTISINLLIITSPVILYSIYKIKKESPGPVFFKQKRIGLNGKEFKCIKFRSMIVDAEKDGAQFATKSDSRIYPWGKFMRKTRIDELPQLFNVLRGDMHLIGPRPERKIWIDGFEKEIPYYNQRHIVKPGLTGWAQVLYPYGENSYDAKQKLMYDLYYIKHWNLWLEIKTIWKTVLVILYRKGI